MRKYWTIEEMNFIKKNIATMSIQELANHFNVSYSKMIDKIHKMKLNRKEAAGIIWTSKEDDILREMFIWAPKNSILEKLPNRTWTAILQRGNKTLNLNRESQDRYKIDYNFFENWTQETAYIYGFILADGYLKYESGINNENSLQFELADFDVDILFKIKECLKFEGEIKYSKRNTAKLSINNKKIIKDLIDKGIPKENKTLKACFPTKMPKNLYPHFVRGLFDGDGTIYVPKDFKRISFQLLGTYDLLHDIKNILPCNTVKNNISDRSQHKYKANVCAFKLTGEKAISIFEWMYKDATIFLDRKHKKYIDYKNSIIIQVPS